MSNLLSHARRELQHLTSSEDEMDREMGKAILELLLTFANQGHSGFSAGYAISAFTKLARYEPLRPLLGTADEWGDVGQNAAGIMMYQNKRCPRVFKDGFDGQAYDIAAVVFVEPNGSAYSSSESRRYIEFPYTPHTEEKPAPTPVSEIIKP